MSAYPVMKIYASVRAEEAAVVAYVDCELLRKSPATEWRSICIREAAPYAETLTRHGHETEWSNPVLVELPDGRSAN